jgi:5'-nucleotidase (lipoprotein e(P4) family)
MKLIIKKISLIVLVLLTYSCSLIGPQSDNEFLDFVNLKSGKNAELDLSRGKNQHLLQASIWYGYSGESKALIYQAFNTAKMRIQEKLKASKPKEKFAIVIDIDETVLSNISYHEYLIKSGKEYPYNWKNWLAKKEAKPLPGVRRFLNYLKKINIEIYYTSNRPVNFFNVTFENLQNVKVPVKRKNILFLSDNKNIEYRKKIFSEKDRKIILFIGDNLNDFSEIFNFQNMEKRRSLVDLKSEEFGRKFIILPNPIYGDWEKAILEYNDENLSNIKKNKLKRALLKGFKL